MTDERDGVVVLDPARLDLFRIGGLLYVRVDGDVVGSVTWVGSGGYAQQTTPFLVCYDSIYFEPYTNGSSGSKGPLMWRKAEYVATVEVALLTALTHALGDDVGRALLGAWLVVHDWSECTRGWEV